MRNAPLSINADLSQAVAIDSNTLPWHPSPSGTVWRKRLYLDGPAEAGKVTSIVRYEPNAQFPAHDHPQGEEILVLDGVFSDEHGDWPAGSLLLNPEGFHHGPFSKEGCLLFVRLRQYAGEQRQQVSLHSEQLLTARWDNAKARNTRLYTQQGFNDERHIAQWPAGSSFEASYPHGAEILVTQGSIEYQGQTYGAFSWLRFPADSETTLRSSEGCSLFITQNLAAS